MSTGKKRSAGTDRRDSGRDRKRKYGNDGSQIWSKRTIDGPGVWVSCIKGKEKATVGELYDLFDTLANEMWPVVDADGADAAAKGSDDDDDDEGEGLSIEAQIAKELATLKTKKPKPQQRFSNCLTGTPCVVFISCKAPIDPVKMIVSHIKNVEQTGVSKTRYIYRFVPVAGTCIANVAEIQHLCRKVFTPFFAKNPDKKYNYKIELRMRNHDTLDRPTIIQEIAKCVPAGHIVNLDNAEAFILVEVFKSVCGISIVEDYDRLQKFNVMEIANKSQKAGNFAEGEGRVHDKPAPTLVTSN